MHARMILTRLKQSALAIVLMIVAFGVPIHTQASVSDNINATQECLQNPDVACPDTTPTAAEMETPSAAVSFNAWEYVQMLGTFVLVIALLFLVLKFVTKRNQRVQQHALMQNLGGVPVGQQKSIQLVKVGNKIMMVGVGDNVQLLKELDDEAEIEALLSIYNAQQSDEELLPYFMKFFKKKQQPAPPQDFGAELNKRLAEIKQGRAQELEQWRQKEDNER